MNSIKIINGRIYENGIDVTDQHKDHIKTEGRTTTIKGLKMSATKEGTKIKPYNITPTNMDKQQELLQGLQKFIGECLDEGFCLEPRIEQSGELFRISLGIVPMTAQAFKEHQESKAKEEKPKKK